MPMTQFGSKWRDVFWPIRATRGCVSQSAFKIRSRWRVEKTTRTVRARHSSADRRASEWYCPAGAAT